MCVFTFLVTGASSLLAAVRAQQAVSDQQQQSADADNSPTRQIKSEGLGSSMLLLQQQVCKLFIENL